MFARAAAEVGESVPGVVGQIESEGSRHGRQRSEVVALRRESGDDRMVLVSVAELGGPTGGTELVEELDVGLVVLFPFVRQSVFVEYLLNRVHRFAGNTVETFIGIAVQ